MEKFFKLKENKTSISTEVMAGVTTFMTMAYILVVNPDILSQAGMNQQGVFFATAFAAAVSTILMGLLANYPFALAPGMGLNAYFTYSVVMKFGFTWQQALSIILIEGIIFILLSFFKVREVIFTSIPKDLKSAISVGIGLFIALIGLSNSGIIVQDPATIMTLGDLSSHSVLLAIFGIILTAILVSRNVKGAILIGIIITTIVGIPLGVTVIPEGWVPFSMPSGINEVAFKLEFPSNMLSANFLIAIFTFLFIDMFDTVGTLAGVAAKSNMLDEDGKLPRVEKALFADAIGTTIGAFLGTSTTTTFVESSAGVAVGGRTGLSAIVTGLLFFISIILSPLFLLVPAAATAPALVIVGIFMAQTVKNIDWDDFTIAIPAFITMVAMPFTYSIAEGISLGVISYTIINVFSGKKDKVSILLYLLSAVFVARYILLALNLA